MIAYVALALSVAACAGAAFVMMRAAVLIYHMQEIVAAHHQVLKIQHGQIATLEQRCPDTSVDKPTLQ